MDRVFLVQALQSVEGRCGGGDGVLPLGEFQVAGGDVGAEDGQLVVEVVGTGGDGIVVFGYRLLVLGGGEEGVGFGLGGVGLG